MGASGDPSKAPVRDLRKHAVILSGGGAKGAYEIGVMKALFPGYVRSISEGSEIDPVVYTGTSVGSYNAAYLASRPGRDAKTAETFPLATRADAAPDAAARTASILVGNALDDVQRPFRAFIKDEYRPITIHRYHPCSMLGGIFGLLAFESDYVGALIERGFQDAVTHDCDASGCIFPTQSDVTAAARASRQMKRAVPSPAIISG